MIKFYNKTKLQFSKKLRKVSTPAERLLWSKLRNKQFHELKFRRQYVIGKYILDFYCPEKNLGIEIDGSSHDENKYEYDQIREGFIKGLGINLIRFTEYEVNHRIDEVLQTLLNTSS